MQRRVGEQLEMIGLTETLRHVTGRPRRKAEQAHELLSALPSADELAFLHSGLAQTFLPHSRPDDNRAAWFRKAGRFTLMVQPGLFDGSRLVRAGRQPTQAEQGQIYVGVPYGTKARLILIYLHTEGVRSRTVSLGPSLSAFLRSLGLPVTGGPRGRIGAVREQCLCIARCQFTMQWEERDADGNERTRVTDTRIAEGMELWRAATGDGWAATLELSAAFHDALREHAVPLDKRGLAHLSDNSLGCSATIWVKAGDNQDECPDRAAGGMIVAADRRGNA